MKFTVLALACLTGANAQTPMLMMAQPQAVSTAQGVQVNPAAAATTTKATTTTAPVFQTMGAGLSTTSFPFQGTLQGNFQNFQNFQPLQMQNANGITQNANGQWVTGGQMQMPLQNSGITFANNNMLANNNIFGNGQLTQGPNGQWMVANQIANAAPAPTATAAPGAAAPIFANNIFGNGQFTQGPNGQWMVAPQNAAAPVVLPGAAAACKDDAEWAGVGFGNCATYALGQKNHQFCLADKAEGACKAACLQCTQAAVTWPTAAQAAPEVKEPEPETCFDDEVFANTWGNCGSYAKGKRNHVYCKQDKVDDMCPKACGKCTPKPTMPVFAAQAQAVICADNPEWNAGYGKCDTYASGKPNAQYCVGDKANMPGACQKACGACQAAVAPAGMWPAPAAAAAAGEGAAPMMTMAEFTAQFGANGVGNFQGFANTNTAQATTAQATTAQATVPAWVTQQQGN